VSSKENIVGFEYIRYIIFHSVVFDDQIEICYSPLDFLFSLFVLVLGFTTFVFLVARKQSFFFWHVILLLCFFIFKLEIYGIGKDFPRF